MLFMPSIFLSNLCNSYIDELLYRPDETLYRPNKLAYHTDELVYHPDNIIIGPHELYIVRLALYIGILIFFTWCLWGVVYSTSTERFLGCQCVSSVTVT